MSTHCKPCDGTGKAPTKAELRGLRTERERMGLSRREMGRRIGKSHVYLGDVEGAKRGVSWHVYRLLLRQYYAQAEEKP